MEKTARRYSLLVHVDYIKLHTSVVAAVAIPLPRARNRCLPLLLRASPFRLA
jgi:hypothetical protein